jgi:hypothetical protein
VALEKEDWDKGCRCDPSGKDVTFCPLRETGGDERCEPNAGTKHGSRACDFTPF